ncbi:unnamed protein product [Brugia pahangi]|uniref:Uncharacterized protein n=1 Tax=Brugia pahangi TaxID=6280 RepID=A0A0N4TBA2_BRUPA|nr:unnamed protein product [Brugia pahangi]
MENSGSGRSENFLHPLANVNYLQKHFLQSFVAMIKNTRPFGNRCTNATKILVSFIWVKSGGLWFWGAGWEGREGNGQKTGKGWAVLSMQTVLFVSIWSGDQLAIHLFAYKELLSLVKELDMSQIDEIMDVTSICLKKENEVYIRMNCWHLIFSYLRSIYCELALNYYLLLKERLEYLLARN